MLSSVGKNWNACSLCCYKAWKLLCNTLYPFGIVLHSEFKVVTRQPSRKLRAQLQLPLNTWSFLPWGQANMFDSSNKCCTVPYTLKYWAWSLCFWLMSYFPGCLGHFSVCQIIHDCVNAKCIKCIVFSRRRNFKVKVSVLWIVCLRAEACPAFHESELITKPLNLISLKVTSPGFLDLNVWRALSP